MEKHILKLQKRLSKKGNVFRIKWKGYEDSYNNRTDKKDFGCDNGKLMFLKTVQISLHECKS